MMCQFVDSQFQHVSTRLLKNVGLGARNTEVMKTFRATRSSSRADACGSRPFMGVIPAGEIRQGRWEKPNMNFMTSVVLGFGSTNRVETRNDGSHKKLGRRIFEFGPKRRCFAGFGLIWLGRVSTRLDLQIRRRRFL